MEFNKILRTYWYPQDTDVMSMCMKKCHAKKKHMFGKVTANQT